MKKSCERTLPGQNLIFAIYSMECIWTQVRTCVNRINTLWQWFPTYAPRHTSAPRGVFRCAAKNIEVKFNQVHVRFKKFHAADVSQYGTVTILLVVIELFLVGECIIQVNLRLNKVRCVAALRKIMHEINGDCDIYKH